MPKRLKPCPFDNSRDVTIDHFNGDYHGKCQRCGAQGPTADTWAEAETLWNTRAGRKGDGNGNPAS